MKFKACVFDLDGTLLNTLDDITDCMNAALAAYGFAGHGTEAYKYFIGDGTDTMVERALPAGYSRDDVETVHERYTRLYEEHKNDKTRPYDGVPALLRELNRRGVPVAVLSNKPHAATQAVVAHHFGDIRFGVVLGHREGVPIKPDPAGAFEICALLGVEPAEVLYLGDTAVDMLTGTAAGFFTLGALWGFRTADELAENGAAELLDAPLRMLDFLA